MLLARYEQRAASGERHPGHLDAYLTAEFSALAQMGKWDPVPLESDLIIVDTTDFGKIDYEGLAGRIRSAAGMAR